MITQPPVIATAIEEIYAKDKDKNFLSKKLIFVVLNKTQGMYFFKSVDYTIKNSYIFCII